MSTRANYLARTLLTRTRALAGNLAEEGVSPALARERRRDVVAKVLVVEEGIVEETKVRLVLEAACRPGDVGARVAGTRGRPGGTALAVDGPMTVIKPLVGAWLDHALIRDRT